MLQIETRRIDFINTFHKIVSGEKSSIVNVSVAKEDSFIVLIIIILIMKQVISSSIRIDGIHTNSIDTQEYPVVIRKKIIVRQTEITNLLNIFATKI